MHPSSLLTWRGKDKSYCELQRLWMHFQRCWQPCRNTGRHRRAPPRQSPTHLPEHGHDLTLSPDRDRHIIHWDQVQNENVLLTAHRSFSSVAARTSVFPLYLLSQCSCGWGWPVTLQATETRSPTDTVCCSADTDTSGASGRQHVHQLVEEGEVKARRNTRFMVLCKVTNQTRGARL